MTRFIALLALWLSLLACEAHTRPACTTFEVHLEDPTPEVVSLLVVIDPHVAVERRAHLAASITSGVRVLISGDIQGDGLQDFPPPNALRLAVITSSGTLVASLPTPAPPTPRSFVADADGVLTIWPNTSEAWDAWLTSTFSQRLMDGFAMPVAANTPSAAALAFLETHPAFAPGSSALVLMVTDRDEEGDADLITGIRVMRAINPGRFGVALIGAAPDGTNVESGGFRGVLGPQTFDESRVVCSDGTAAGRYPRRLLEMLERLGAWGASVSMESLCVEAQRLFLNAFVWRGVGRVVGACLPTALPSSEEGLVDCRATLLLPEFGGHRCADFDLAVAAVVDAGNGFVRERCVLPQIPYAGGVFPEDPQGFFYDSTDSAPYHCPRTPQRLEVTTRIGLTGATLDAQCRWPTPMCLESLDAGFRDAAGDGWAE